MQDILTAAISLHQSGQLASASPLYQRVLATDPQNADALHLFGVLNHQQGNQTQALELIGRAVALRPNYPAFHANLAEVYRALGQFERAAGSCRAALRLLPDYPEALCNLGLALQGLGRHAEAVEQFRAALRLRPDFAVVHGNLAISLRELGQWNEALELFRRAVELEPHSAPAHTNLGQLLLDLNRPEEALPPCQEAVRLQPDRAALHHNLGNVLRRLGRPVEARAAYLEALRLDPNLAVAHDQMGLSLADEGKIDEALVWLNQAVQMAPDNPVFWQHMAELHGEEQAYAAAIPCWERVISLLPNSGIAHVALGWAHQEEGRLDEAKRCYEIASRVQPDCGAAQLNLGGLYEEEGDLAKAEAAFREALRLQPAFALPHARLATLLRGKLPDPDLAALEKRLSDPEISPAFRARMLFGLAHVLDARGDYARAAECLRQGNALSVELAKGRRDYGLEEHERFVTNLLRAFDQDFFTRTAGLGLDTKRPVFIFGLPRSGTTLVEQVLASHPNICGAGELRLGRRSLEAIPEVMGRSDAPLACVGDIDASALRLLADRHMAVLRQLDGGRAERIVDKMPDNYMHVGLLAAMFPNAVFIHCRRDLRDIAVSCWMTDFRSIWWANDKTHIAHRFQQYRRLMDHWRAILPATIHHVDYEETVADLETVARRLLAACGQEWHPKCLEFFQTNRPIRTASVSQVRQPVYKHAVARWKNYERDLADLFAALPLDDARER
ncbi:MAG TPA: tetratricopeptide repeat protein [Gemmataceae bacterium]|nr:tetratricopeptide repeat protein [Gemmataceae bacterium]